MKQRLKNSFLLSMLLVGVGSVMTGQAQTFTVLHTFNGNDGAAPNARPVLSDGTMYGTTQYGGSSNNSGTVFAMNRDGTGFRSLHNFNGSDGAQPQGDLVLSSNVLFGTTYVGGSSGFGTIFKVSKDGTGFVTLYSFSAGASRSGGSQTNSDGANPSGALVLSGDRLYGTAYKGGATGLGTVFAVNTDGSGFATIYNFNDGGSPVGLTLSSNILYGTTITGGIWGNGTVFAVNTDGTGFTVLHTFMWSNDGSGPVGVTLSGNALYGTTQGCCPDSGTVFVLNTDGSGFKTLHNFTGGSDGGGPYSELVISGSTLYGTAYYGGSFIQGTLFSLCTDGTGFTTLYRFSGGMDGLNPKDFVLLGNTIYGMATGGGSGSVGTVFSISFSPQLSISPSGSNMVLSWPTSFTGFTLQSTTNLISSALWTTNLPAPVVVNGQNTVTNPITGAQQFFRLSQ